LRAAGGPLIGFRPGPFFPLFIGRGGGGIVKRRSSTTTSATATSFVVTVIVVAFPLVVVWSLAATGLAATFFALLASCGLTIFGERVGALFLAAGLTTGLADFFAATFLATGLLTFATFATFLGVVFLGVAFFALFFAGLALAGAFLDFTDAAFFTNFVTTFFMEFPPFTRPQRLMPLATKTNSGALELPPRKKMALKRQSPWSHQKKCC
jgi:hypothetical protein